MPHTCIWAFATDFQVAVPTCTGLLCSGCVSLPSPSSPSEFSPQQYNAPSFWMAQTLALLSETATQSGDVPILTGAKRKSAPPSPTVVGKPQPHRLHPLVKTAIP